MRHDSSTVGTALRLHEGGWTADGIANVLAREGITVDDRTVKTWIDEEFAERRRYEQRMRMRHLNAKRTGGRLGAGPKRSPEFRLERMRSLRGLGMSFSAIAKVMTFDFPDTPLCEHHVRDALTRGTTPRSMKERVA